MLLDYILELFSEHIYMYKDTDLIMFTQVNTHKTFELSTWSYVEDMVHIT